MLTFELHTKTVLSFEEFVQSNLLVTYTEVKVNSSDGEEELEQIKQYTLGELYKEYCDDYKYFVTDKK